MNAIVQEWIIDNDARSASKGQTPPRLSVLIPFLNDDPRRLIAALDREAVRLGGAVELLLLDDGSDAELAEIVMAGVQELQAPPRLIQLFANEGRSRGRNRLARHARAQHFLF